MWRYLVDREKEETEERIFNGKKRCFSESTCLIPERSSRTRRDGTAAAVKRERHNKVPTSKGLRDRRVRISAPTAIEFYDIQDRLGFDQPSKAIDWLILKARSSIEPLLLVTQAPFYGFGLTDPSAELIDSNHNHLQSTDPLIFVPGHPHVLSSDGFSSGGFVRF